MAAKNLREAIQTGLCRAQGKIDHQVLGEVKDFLAHSVARHCKKNNAMDQYDVLSDFIREVIKEPPYESAVDLLSPAEFEALGDRAFTDEACRAAFIKEFYAEFSQAMAEQEINKDKFCDHEFTYLEKFDDKFLEFALEYFNKQKAGEK